MSKKENVIYGTRCNGSHVYMNNCFPSFEQVNEAWKRLDKEKYPVYLGARYDRLFEIISKIEDEKVRQLALDDLLILYSRTEAMH